MHAMVFRGTRLLKGTNYIMISYQSIKQIKVSEFMNVYLAFDTLQCFECTYFSDISIYNYSAYNSVVSGEAWEDKCYSKRLL